MIHDEFRKYVKVKKKILKQPDDFSQPGNIKNCPYQCITDISD